MITSMMKAVEEKKFDTLDTISVKVSNSYRFPVPAKTLYMYFPEELLPINSLNHLRDFLRCFGEEPNAELFACNRQLLTKLRSLPEFNGFDTQQMMRFLYNCLPYGEKGAGGGGGGSVIAPDDQISPLMDIASRTRNILLYGPPGGGKTWLVNHFATSFLLHHNLSAEKAEKYWQAVLAEDDATCRSLRAEVRAEEETGQAEPAYWWIGSR